MKKIKKEKAELLSPYAQALWDLEDAKKGVKDAMKRARKMSLAVKKAKANRQGVPNG